MGWEKQVECGITQAFCDSRQPQVRRSLSVQRVRPMLASSLSWICLQKRRGDFVLPFINNEVAQQVVGTLVKKLVAQRQLDWGQVFHVQ